MSLSWAGPGAWPRLGLLGVCLALAACSSGPVKPSPTELSPDPRVLSVQQVWTSKMGAVTLPLQVSVVGSSVTLGGDDGQVLSLDAVSGASEWRVAGASSAGLSAGIGSDGKVTAAVSRGNELVSWVDGREVFRFPLAAQVFTAPLVAGGRIFVLVTVWCRPLMPSRGANCGPKPAAQNLWFCARPACCCRSETPCWWVWQADCWV